VNKNRICLIIPPSPFLTDERVFPFLGILKVAAVLEQRGIITDVLDLSGISNYEDVMTYYLKEHKDVDIFGLTSTSPQNPSIIKVFLEIIHPTYGQMNLAQASWSFGAIMQMTSQEMRYPYQNQFCAHTHRQMDTTHYRMY
jgi:hypothetical protein